MIIPHVLTFHDVDYSISEVRS